MTNFFSTNDRKAYTTLAAIGLAFMLIVSVVSYATAEDRSDSLEKEIRSGHAKNVILLIGDGMGDSEITIARNYEVGAAGRLAMDELPLTCNDHFLCTGDRSFDV
jgi:alkaline phosphatase